MELTLERVHEKPAESLEKPTESIGPIALEPTSVSVKPKRKHVRTKPRLLTRAEISSRSINAVKQFDSYVSAIIADLGGRDQLTTMELGLIEAYAGRTRHVGQYHHATAARGGDQFIRSGARCFNDGSCCQPARSFPSR